QAYLPAVFSRTWLAVCLAEVGAFVEAIAMGEEGVRIAEAVDHPFSRIGAYRSVGAVYCRKGDLHQAIPLLEPRLELSQVGNTPGWFFIIAFALVPAYAQAGRLAEALRLLEQAEARGAMLLRGHASRHDALRVTAFSEAYLRAGRPGEASAHAREAL